jgi:pyruvate dehydrogenase E2 component (dihydrolipoamide acetyltransferase)
MARQEVRVPDLGDFKDVEIVEVSVKPGDAVRVEQPLLTLETDKAAMEVPSPVAGKVVEVKVAQGGRVSTGDVIVIIDAVAGASEAPAPAKPAASSPPAKPASPAAAAPPAPAPLSQAPRPAVAAPAPAAQGERALPPIDEGAFARAHASPSVRKFARELGVDLGQVRGSGPKNRVLTEDVKAWVKSALRGRAAAGPALPPVPEVDFARYGPVEVSPLSRVRKISGPRLQAAWLNIPHVTQHDEADITALEARRQKLKKAAAKADVRLTLLAFIIRACVLALKEFPDFNSSLSADGTSLVQKRYWHIGFAADTPQGLVVPVIRDADQKDLLTIAGELGDKSERARAGKLPAEEMRGGSFTVSSLGGIGGTHFTPIINAPEVAILGVGRSQHMPVWDTSGKRGRFVPRLMLPLSLSYDHRVIDGATGVRFTTLLVGLLADPDKLAD